MVQRIRPFTEKDFALGGNYDQKFSGDPIRGIGLRFAATLGGTSATVRTDGTFRLLGTPEIVQNEAALIRWSGASWRLFSAIQSGSFDNYLAPTTTPAMATAWIDFEALMPGAMINGADKEVSLRGTFGQLTDYAASGTTTVTGKLRGSIETSENDPTQGFWRPAFKESGTILSPTDANTQSFKYEQDTAIVGAMIRAQDTSAVDRVDALIRKLRVDHVGDQGDRELSKGTWGTFRSKLCKRFTPEDAVRSVGCIFVPLIDKRNPHLNNAVLMRAGDSLTFTFDCTGSVEEDMGSAVTADGSSDLAIVNLVQFTRVKGTGDVQTAQQRVLYGGTGYAPQSEIARRRLAAAQRIGA